MSWHVIALMLCCLLSHSHADIPEASICYMGALMESVIRTGQEVWLLPQLGLWVFQGRVVWGGL